MSGELRTHCGYRWAARGREHEGTHICAYPPDARHPQDHRCRCGASTKDGKA